MKIAYAGRSVIPSRRANSIHIMKMCAALAGEGNNVTLITGCDKDTEPGIDNVYKYYGVPECFTIVKISRCAPFFYKWKSIGNSYNIARYVHNKGFDFIYSRDLYTSFFTAFIFHKPVIFECHSSFWSGTDEEEIFKKILKTGFLKKIVVITGSLKQYFISTFDINEKLIYVAPDGADAPGETAQIKLIEKSFGKFQVGYIGHLYPGKGIETIGEMALSCPFAFFHIIGGTEEAIKYWKDKYNHIDNIHFYGFIPPAQTAAYGKEMDVLIAPYQKTISTAGSSKPEHSIDKWISPLKIFEYMALGKPIICSDLLVLREVMADEKNCLLCTYDNVREWSEAIKKIYENEQLASKLADNALKSFEKYSWNARAKNLIQDVVIDKIEKKEKHKKEIRNRIYIFRYIIAFVYFYSLIVREKLPFFRHGK